MCQFPVAVEAVRISIGSRMLFPGTRMYFIDGKSSSSRIRLFSLFQPCGIAPFETCDIRDTGCIARAHLRPVCIRICFVQQSSVHGTDTEFVQISHFRSCNKSFPDTDRSGLFHRMPLRIPVIKLTHNRNILCVRCPYCKIRTAFSILCYRMRSQFLINIIMRCLTKQILIQFPKLHLCHIPVSFFFYLNCLSSYFSHSYLQLFHTFAVTNKYRTGTAGRSHTFSDLSSPVRVLHPALFPASSYENPESP